MATVTRYNILELCSIQPDSMGQLQRWHQTVARLLTEAVGSSTVSLFTLNPDKARSIGYDLGNDQEEGKFNAVKYLVSDLGNDLAASVGALLEADEFYLGRLVLVMGSLTTEMIQSLIICWDGDLALAGVELFKMGSDGLCIYWYNPSSPDEAQYMITRLSSEQVQ